MRFIRLFLPLLLWLLPFWAMGQYKWAAKDTLFVMYPNGCHFYKQPDVNSDKYFTFVRSSKVILLDPRPQSALMQIDGVWGHLKLVRWESYIGYVFDGFLTSLYVCKFENCRNIIEAFDWYNIREFSHETLLECKPQELENTPTEFRLYESCDSVQIWWRMGVRYEAYRSPTKYSEVYTVPFTNVQELFLWAKLLYFDLFNASLKSPKESIEQEKEGKVHNQKFSYRYDIEGKLSYFTATCKSYEKETRRLMSDFYIEIRNMNKKFVQVSVERNYYNQLLIKNRE